MDTISTSQKADLYSKLLHTLEDFDKTNGLNLTTEQAENLVRGFNVFLHNFIAKITTK